MRKLARTPGNDWRLRIQTDRCVASLVRGTDGRLHAFLHQFEKRSEVYKSDTFLSRLTQFYCQIASKYSEVNIAQLQGRYVAVDPARPVPGQLPSSTLHHELKPRQQDFYDFVLPIRSLSRPLRSELVIGHGPPGSGKTTLAQQMVLGARETGSKVDVLVPSAPLKAEYREALESCGLQVDVSGDSDADADVRLLEFPEHFAMLAGIPIDHSRERKIREWWNLQLANPRLRSRLRQPNNEELQTRLPLLIDAILEDEDFWRRRPISNSNKDFMGEQVSACIDSLRAVREHLLPATPTGDALPTRAWLALQALQQSRTVMAPKGDRFIIVDEAQDLAPAEYRALIVRWLNTPQDGQSALRKLVFLGDEEQRVSLVPFSWDDLKHAARDLANIKSDQIEEKIVDHASYRMRRTVASVARTVWSKEVMGDGKFRQQTRLDFERLADGGTVDVVIAKQPTSLDRGLEHCLHDTSPGEFIFVVTGVELNERKADQRIFAYPIRQAKGLEANKVVVHYPFGKSPSRRARQALPADAIMEYYVSVSRAQDHVLLILDTPSWDELRRCRAPWTLPGVRVHEFDSVSDGALVPFLRSCVVTLSAEQVRQTLLEQLGTQCRDAGNAHSLDGIMELLARLSRAPSAELIEPLLFNSTMLARYNVVTLKQLWKRGIDAYHAGDMSTAICTLLLAGESGAAATLAASFDGPATQAWDVEWLAMYADESHVQAWRRRHAISRICTESTIQQAQRLAVGYGIDRLRIASHNLRKVYT